MIHSLPKSIGVWGLGIVGRSVIRHLREQGHDVGVMDKKAPNSADTAWLDDLQVPFFPESDKETFFTTYKTIVPSCGIDLRPYANSGLTFLSELDLFALAYEGKIIGITGTIAKTSVTSLITQTLQHAAVPVVMGGNIGVGLLDLIKQPADYAVIELSSFQLERANTCAVDCAIITNFFPNHLDRHDNEAAYWAAKERIISMQKPGGIVLAHADVLSRLTLRADRTYAFFSETVPLNPHVGHIYFYRDGSGNILKQHNGRMQIIAHADEMPDLSFPSNWMIVVAAFDLLAIKRPALNQHQFVLPDHRLHCIATIKGVAFYDDSKSTIPQSTLAAVQRLSTKPTIVLIGGLSKGVDRKPFVQALKPHVKSIVCFGKEAEQLCAFARATQIEAYQCATLDDAVAQAYAVAHNGDQIVLSPAGSSFDLFANYHERGVAFSALVERLKACQS